MKEEKAAAPESKEEAPVEEKAAKPKAKAKAKKKEDSEDKEEADFNPFIAPLGDAIFQFR